MSANRNGSLTYNVSPDAGYYTHYVDSTDPARRIQGNIMVALEPRLTVPRDLPAGSVVEIHNIATPTAGASSM